VIFDRYNIHIQKWADSSQAMKKKKSNKEKAIVDMRLKNIFSHRLRESTLYLDLQRQPIMLID
jgi:hypothetical protein